MYNVLFTKKSLKGLDKLASTDIKRILLTLKSFTYPFPLKYNIRKMVGTIGFYRLRVGNIRIPFELDHDRKEIWIRKIAYRGSIY
ncbi:hypothetical protein COV53_00125 [Candidatus Gottesmanbacteria bacterium CG11_big_fil_rev_8_21_14_0_20_37_11]|uniref:Toxin YoeB n=2 Tax=Candidatus Gottesmaniibacteriota TaxID=1752720 RepID=A0A1J4TTB0_9BACT|nr:MAG: hypothetical protein AUJ73_03075 [Candidatus Gottesmanbacteria bacterium CG1_02_37_22]PIR08996.1 MAG: hypothetical protein COV53_00125 [Candidatus Gottesmanbacteria bacterium CG11_big_fil_rev_8_21_14_0_20_37_11]